MTDAGYSEGSTDRSSADREAAPITAEDVMTSLVVACRGEVNLEEVAEILASRNISGMPVVDAEGNVVGMISEKDLAQALGSSLVRLAVRRYSHGSQPRERSTLSSRTTGRGNMAAPAIVAAPDETVTELARLMVENHLNRLPIIRDGRLVGVVTRGDVLRVAAGVKRATSDRHEVVRISGTPV